MNWFLLSLFFPLIFGSYVYNVKVDLAENLPDEDPDAPTIFGYTAWVNKNDPYIQILAYGSGGDDKIKVEQTKICESTDEPQWDEQFQFNDADSNGPYLKFLFKAYDDDSTFGSSAVNDPDYLGETREIQIAEIVDCESDFEFRLPVARDGKECGLLVVEISKDGCDESDDTGYDAPTACCDPDEVARVEASGACRSGCACCPDGSYVGSIGDGRTFPCDNGNNELVDGEDEFGELCEVEDEYETDDDASTQTEKSTKGTGKGSKSAAYAGYEQMDGDCLVGDIVYVNGQSIGIIGDLCNDDSTTTYVGLQSFCRDGEIVEEGYDGDCESEYPGSSCCQQGEPGTFGAAVCITRECVPYDGGNVGTSSPDEGAGDCLVGDIMYTNGQVVGLLGDTCNDDGSYLGRKSICVDGQVVDEDYVGDCNEEYYGSSCCQIGPLGTIGAAVCQKDVECVPYTVDEGEIGSGPLPSNDGSCLVGDIMYLNGDSTGFIGYTCSEESDAVFTGKQGICRDGEVVDEDYFGECSVDTICCQQGEPDTIGGAVCVTEENCVEYDDEDDETDEYGIESDDSDTDNNEVCCSLEDIETIEASGACREGCQCCPDGSYVGSIGDGRTFPCDNGNNELVIGVDEFGEICDDNSGDSDNGGDSDYKEYKDKSNKGGGKTRDGYRRLLNVN